MNLPEGCKINYWKTSHSDPGTWMSRAEAEVCKAGGKVLGHAFGTAEAFGSAAFMLSFEAGGQQFNIVWPVLPHDMKDERAARVQAATLLHHDVKARCLSARVMGFKRAFFSYLRLPNGRTAGGLGEQELLDSADVFAPTRLLPEGET